MTDVPQAPIADAPGPPVDLRITVAICTWNRCRSLHETLDGFTGVAAPARTTWELLVVNNNCSDGTDDVIRAFESRLPIRRAFEPRPGLSHARNRAVAEARGDYVVWTDDDVTVCRGFLVAYAEAFRRWPEAAIFGGPIEPWFDGTPPAWLRQVYPTIAGVYAARDFGSAPVPFSAPHVIPWGANYAIRGHEQSRYPYDPELGYRPGKLVGWEETEVILALLANRATGWWVPEAALRHRVAKERQTTKYLRTHFFNRGIYYGSHRTDVDKRLVFGRPRWLWKQVVETELKYRVHRLLSRPEVWMEHLISSSESWGLLHGYTPRTRG